MIRIYFILSSYSYKSISQLSSQKNNIPHSIQIQRNYSQLCFSKSSSNGISNLKMSNAKVLNQSNTNTIISITAKAVKKKDKRESAKSSDSKRDKYNMVPLKSLHELAHHSSTMNIKAISNNSTIKIIPKKTSDSIRYINESFKQVQRSKMKKEERIINTKRSAVSSYNNKPIRNLSYQRALRHAGKENDEDLNKLDAKLNQIYQYFHQGEKNKSSVFDSPKLINRIRSKRKLEEMCNKIKCF